MVRLFALHRRARRIHHGPHARTGRAVPRSVPREWCRHLLLLRRCALAELDLVGPEHAIHGDELARRHHLRPDHRRDVRVAVAALTRKDKRRSYAPTWPDSGGLMKRVTGIGGIFFSAKDPVALRAW